MKVLTLREQHKDDLDTVVGLVLSHIMAHRKGKLVMTILDHVKQSGLTVSNPDSKLYQVLQGLAALEARYVHVCAFYVLNGRSRLSSRSSTQVSLKACEVLIACQMPSYEERKGQMEGVLKTSVNTSYYGEQGSTGAK